MRDEHFKHPFMEDTSKYNACFMEITFTKMMCSFETTTGQSSALTVDYLSLKGHRKITAVIDINKRIPLRLRVKMKLFRIKYFIKIRLDHVCQGLV